MSHRSRSPERGFTLLELLVAGTVVGIIAVIAMVALLNALDKARQRATMADMRGLSTAVESYMVDQSLAPSSTDISNLVQQVQPYSGRLPTRDHWNNLYSYESSNALYTIESFGKDGQAGADITLATRFEFELDIVLANGQFSAAPE